MAVKHASVTVGTTATDLTSGVVDTDLLKIAVNDVQRTVTLTNTGTVTVYLGGSNVTSTTYGYALAASSSMAYDLGPSDVLYGVVASGTAIVRTLHTGV